MLFFDTEGVGTTGPLVLIQYSSPQPTIHHVWETKVRETLELIEWITKNEVVGFNLVHDWFQLVKWYNIFRQVENKDGTPNEQEIREIERRGPDNKDVCLKPKRACDLMLLARSGKYQYLAKHKPITIRKVPVQMCDMLIQELSHSVQLPKGVQCRWRISEKRNYLRTDVKDIIGEFKGLSTSLKHLYAIITGKEEDPGTFLTEVGKVPYEDEPDWKPWGGNWSTSLRFLRLQFKTSQRAITYAKNDIIYTYELWKALGSPEGGDDDSELTCLVGASHWKGFAVAPTNVLQEKINKYVQDWRSAPTSPNDVYDYLYSYLNDVERMILNVGTGKKQLQEFLGWKGHPIIEAVKKVQVARRGQNRLGILKKLLITGRFCFSMKVQGALSSRMSGGSDIQSSGTNKKLNVQGIPRESEFRNLFLMSFPNEKLEGGDFDAFEITIADAVYHDSQLHNDLLSGQKIHAITGSYFYNQSYDEILASKGTLDDKYTKSKNGFFSWIYGAFISRTAETLGISIEDAEAGVIRLRNRYQKIDQHRGELRVRFSPLTQEGGIGTSVEWTEPEQYIESILGFRRYFDLEWSNVRGLWELSNKPPEEWKRMRGECRRTNRAQSLSGATQSALFSAAFSLQGHVFRAAANHEIQSPGAQITKNLQRKLWDLQPPGINPWTVRPLNIHDEVLCCKINQECGPTVNQVISSFQNKIPLLKMKWNSYLKNWGEKE